MRVARTAAAVVVMIGLGGLCAAGQDGAGAAGGVSLAEVTFAFERPGLPVPKFALTIHEDGTGSYKGEEVVRGGGSAGSPGPVQGFDRPVNVSNATASRIFQLTHDLRGFRVVCASKAKVADTGKKTLTYRATDGEGACVYNYSERKEVQQLTTIFEGIAETMDEGRQLERLHKYDRLGLDAALAALANSVSEGRALELGTIAATLQEIAGDDEVMQRARTRADALLARGEAEHAKASRE